MKEKPAQKKRSGAASRRRRIIITIVGVILIAGALFWGLFFVNSIEVVGNSGKNYTDQEIIEMALPEFWTKNSVLLQLFRRKADLRDVRFMESVEVEVTSRNSIRLHVNEKKPIGYVRVNNTDYYFDHEGIVLEIMSADETAQLKQQTADVQQTDVQADSSSGTEQTDVQTDPSSAEDTNSVASSAETTDTNQTGEAADDGSSDKNVEEFDPNLADVPMITGLEVSGVEVGQRLPLSNPTFFNTIQFLTKMIDKYGIQPDYVEITEDANGDREMTLYYGTVRAALGTDSNLEEKVTRLAAILPKLSGRSGILHLEEFTSDTINIVFDADQ